MCGIIAYIGRRPVVEILVKGLRRLEYRGYDSSGVGIMQDDGAGTSTIKVVKCVGKVRRAVRHRPRQSQPPARIGRAWCGATHGGTRVVVQFVCWL